MGIDFKDEQFALSALATKLSSRQRELLKDHDRSPSEIADEILTIQKAIELRNELYTALGQIAQD